MVLVNHTNKMPDDHTFTTKACGSATAVNKTLQTEAADAFLAMQAAAAKDGVTIWMQSGYRSVDYQKNLYDQKTQYFRNKGLSEAEAKKQAANIVNPPGYSEHNCGLAADLNSPEHTDLTEGFENTEPSAAERPCRGIRLHPAVPQKRRSRYRDHLRAVALALCGAGKCGPDPAERPVL